MKKEKKASRVPLDDLLRYEMGEMSDDEVVSMFQALIDTGLAWQLQGHYGRTAVHLIETGYCVG
jgi:hypothetical protein